MLQWIVALVLALTWICTIVGYAPLGLGLTVHSASYSPSPKPSLIIARFVWSPNPNGAYPTMVHIQVNAST